MRTTILDHGFRRVLTDTSDHRSGPLGEYLLTQGQMLGRVASG
jgi:hypothetical protein